MAKVLNLTAGSGVAGGQEGGSSFRLINRRGRIYARLWAKVPAAELLSRFEPMTPAFVERSGAGWGDRLDAAPGNGESTIIGPPRDREGSHEDSDHRIDRDGILPRPKRRIPMWLGGSSEAAFDGAARIGDGFPFSGRTQTDAVQIKAKIEVKLAALGKDCDAFGFESVQFRKWVLNYNPAWALRISTGSDELLYRAPAQTAFRTPTRKCRAVLVRRVRQ
jgi:hypothetical protein